MLDPLLSMESTLQAHARDLGDMPQDSSEHRLYLACVMKYIYSLAAHSTAQEGR